METGEGLEEPRSMLLGEGLTTFDSLVRKREVGCQEPAEQSPLNYFSKGFSSSSSPSLPSFYTLGRTWWK